jgi:hypothetical protein
MREPRLTRAPACGCWAGLPWPCSNRLKLRYGPVEVLCMEANSTRAETARILRAVWERFDVAADDRERIVSRVEALRGVACGDLIALKTALDEWANSEVNTERSEGLNGAYLVGPHWNRVSEIAYLLARGYCQGWNCSTRRRLQRHHHHYDSVGWESLFAISVLCDKCHRRTTYGDRFYEVVLEERRTKEREQRDRALRALGEVLPEDLIPTSCEDLIP